MPRALKPIRSRNRARLPVTLATYLLPIAGLFVILNLAPVRSPFVETEAPLALAARYAGHPLLTEATPPPITTTSVALASLAPRLVGTTEFEQRVLGLLAGILALALTVRLGQRLFSTRVGVIAAVLLFAGTAGRSILGTELSVQPFYLVAVLVAVAAIRNLAVSRISGIYAGIAIGVAVALVGPRAFWITGLAGIWLWRLRGLNLRSVATVLAVIGFSATGTAAVSAGILMLLRPGPIPPLLLTPFTTRTLIDVPLLVNGLLFALPALPIIALGILNRPRRWLWRGSPRFLGIWLLCSAAEFLFSGYWQSLYVALCFATALPCLWAIENAQRRQALFALSATAAVVVALVLFAPNYEAQRSQERWAARETGRFVRRNVDSAERVVAADPLRSRISYYARRPTLRWHSDTTGAKAYVVLPRTTITPVASNMALPREIRIEGDRTRILAEIGPYVIGRISDRPRTSDFKTGIKRKVRTALIKAQHSASGLGRNE